MRAAALVKTAIAATLVAFVGCGGGSGSTGGHGGGGTAGAAGAGGSTAAGGAGGSTGSGGSSATGGSSGALPACAIANRPQDPDNDAGAVSTTSGTCNSIVLASSTIVPGTLVAVDGGARLDGGAIEAPAGGTIPDGDYEFVRWLDDMAAGPSRRQIRVFGGGTYIEWAVTIAGAAADGGDETLKYDTTATVSGHTLTFVSYACGDDLPAQSYDYSVAGEQLVLFNNEGGSLVAVDAYQRTCTRP